MTDFDDVAQGVFGGGGFDERREQRRSNDAYEAAHNARQPKPKPLCTNCLQSVEWARVQGAWWKFEPGTTTVHRCKR